MKELEHIAEEEENVEYVEQHYVPDFLLRERLWDERIRQMRALRDNPDPDLDKAFACLEISGEKEVSRKRYERKKAVNNGKRRNVRENRRQQLRQRRKDRKKKQESKDVKPHSKELSAPVITMYRPYHRGTHQILDCASTNVKLGLWEGTVQALVEHSLEYDEKHPDEVVPCAHRWLYLVVPRDDVEIVLQVSTINYNHINIWDERKSKMFLKRSFPDRYPDLIISPHGEPLPMRDGQRIQEDPIEDVEPDAPCDAALTDEEETQQIFEPVEEGEGEFDLSPSKTVRNELARIAASAEAVPKEERKDILTEQPVMDALSKMQKDAEDIPDCQRDQVDTWLGHAENLLIFAYQMYRASNFTDAFAATVAYVKMYIKGKSVTHELYKLVNEVTSANPEDIVPHGIMDDIVNGWDLLKNHMLFSKISYLISAALSLTVSSIKEIEWSPCGLKLLHIEAAKEQLKAVDLIDAVVRTFAWMTETGYQCMKERSLAPLLYGNQRMREFHILYDHVSAFADSAMAGNYADLGAFEQKTDQAIALVISLKKVKPDGTTAHWLQQKYEKLVEIKEKVIAKRRNTNTRFAPIGWSISGPTGVGKSTLAKLTMSTSLKAMKFKADPSRIITLDEADRYQSTYTSDIEGVYIDDFANMIAQFAAGNGETPAGKIIKFFNNMAAQAVKAELQEKGVVFIDFKCGVITTNVKDLDARFYSNAPEAVLRRFHHVCVEVKPQFRKPGSVSLDPSHPEILKDVSILKDVWQIRIEEVVAYAVREGKVSYKFEPMKVNLEEGPVECKDLSLEQYLQVVVALSRTHKAVQEKVVTKAEQFDSMEYCPVCSLPKPMCKGCKVVEEVPKTCVEIKPHGLEALGDVVVDAAKQSVISYARSWFAPVCWLNNLVGYSPIKKLATDRLAGELKKDLHSFATPWMVAVVPDFMYNSKYFQGAVEYWQSSAAMYNYRAYLHRLAFGTTVGFGISAYKRSWKGGLITSLVTTGGGCVLYAGYCARKMQIRQEYAQRRDALPTYVKKIRDGCVPKYALMSASLVIGVKLLHMWNSRRIETQGLESPEAIDKSKGWFDNWLGSTGFKYECTSAVKNISPDQVTETLPKNLWWASFERADGTRTGSDIVSFQNGFVLMPEHIFYPNGDMTKTPSPWVKAEVKKTAKGAGGYFKFTAERACHSYLFEELDMRMVYVPNLDNVKSAWRFLPVSHPTGSNVANFYTRGKDGQLSVETVCATMKEVAHKYRTMKGGDYTSSQAQDGACMGLITAKKNEPVVLGFHIGGNGSGYGIMQTLTLPRYLEAVTTLGRQDGVVIMAQSAELPKKQLGRDVLSSTEVSDKAKYIKSLGPEAAIHVLGSTKLRAKQKSCVEPSILSKHVTEIMGVACEHGPPQLEPNWEAYNATLEYVVDPSEHFLPSELERARKDWLKDLLPLMDEHASREDFRPMTFKESIMGVEGKRFLDALIMKTSMGFPVFGPKSKHFTEVREGERLVDRVPSQGVLDEYERMISCWSRGERAYPVCSATLKDEPTKIGKKKVRVFQAAPVSLSIAIRMYFLPIARFLSLYPLVSESAVGVNSFSPEWKDLMDHATKFANDNKVIAWDYSKYDVRMNSQVTAAVLKSYIILARRGGYDDQALHIMEAMIADIVHPLIDWNGTLIMAFNMNTSGNNITVNINSTAGSFYVRMGFFNVYPDEKDFRKRVAAMTYGDDFKGSVHQDFRKFDFYAYQAYLASHGMKITLPNKSDDTCAFMEDEDADFLKRVSAYVEGVPVPLGRLTEESIFKSLHSNLRSKSTSKEEVAVSCMETALHEWFAYGREHYEMRREQLTRVAYAAGLCPTKAFVPFDERVAKWHEKYADDVKLEPEIPAPSLLERTVKVGGHVIDTLESIRHLRDGLSDSESSSESDDSE
jgi:hypothetical protein